MYVSVCTQTENILFVVTFNVSSRVVAKSDFQYARFGPKTRYMACNA